MNVSRWQRGVDADLAALRAWDLRRWSIAATGAVGGGVLSVLAIGCPTCNAVAVAALGTGGALAVFAPVQPVLGVAAIAVLLAALHRRLQPPACRVGGAA